MRKCLSFNQGWKFVRGWIPEAVLPDYPVSELERWENVTLPHSLRMEPCDNPLIETCQDIAMYRKHFPLPEEWKERPVFLRFEAVMGVADVYLNGVLLHTALADSAPDEPGKPAHTNYGGYLPFVVDLRNAARFGGEDNVLVVVADNRDNPQVPPGKPQKLLDFTYLGGIYRNVWLEMAEPLHITSALYENIPGGGGVSVHFTDVSEASAQVRVKTHLRNEGTSHHSVQLRTVLRDAEGRKVSEARSAVWMGMGTDLEVRQQLTVQNPHLWDLDTPYLYRLESSLVLGEEALDRLETPVGIRSISTDRAKGLLLNGKRAPLLSGVNRHQDYPFVGAAAADSMQRRDALLFKEAGFNVVRAAHYPMSEEFLRACDELGIFVLEATPGWQWYPASQPEPFTARVHNHIRQMVRRDRNHPCVLAYEVVLNETYHVPYGYTRASAQIALSEHPDARVSNESYAYDCRDEANGVDWESDFMYFHTDEEADCKNPEKAGKALIFIREYGDNFTEASGNFCSHRITRGVTDRFYPGGEARNLQKANRLLWQDPNRRDTLAGKCRQYAQNPAFAGGAIWTGIDSRGFGSILSVCGIWDTFRLPKFSAWAYMSQRPPEKNPLLEQKGIKTGPVLFLAGSWEKTCPVLDKSAENDPSILGTDQEREIYAYSNLSKVRLSVEQGGKILWSALHAPMSAGDPGGLDGAGENSLDYLPHAPFAFHRVPYCAGSVLRAVGYNEAGEAVLEKTLAAAGKPAKIHLEADSFGIPLRADQSDMVFLRAYITDEAGNLCPNAAHSVYFQVTKGDASIAGDGDSLCGSNPICAEGGIASCILRAGKTEGTAEITAAASGLSSDALTLPILPSSREEAAFTFIRQGTLFPGASKNLCDYPVEKGAACFTPAAFEEEGVRYPNSLLSERDRARSFRLKGAFQKLFCKIAPTGAEYRIYLDGVLRFQSAPDAAVPVVLDLENAEMLTLETSGGEGRWLSPYLLEGQWKPDESELRVNLAQGKEATASVNPEKASEILKCSGEWAMWLGTHPQNEPVYWQVDLGAPADIRNVKVNIGGPMGSDSTNFTYRVMTSSDGMNWEKQAENRRTSWSNGVLDYFTAAGVRYIRIEFDAIDGKMPAAMTGFEAYLDFGVDSAAEFDLKGIEAEGCPFVFHPAKKEYILPARPAYTLRILPRDPKARIRVNGKMISNPAGCTMIKEAAPVLADTFPCEIEVTAANGAGVRKYFLKTSAQQV